ncbi:MAG: Crp/Fnr family transcriptional regulator [Deltaproteobacteria bacterium]|nr:Crp/Fnr family transcriptional regulator [Deltaproteobacteria bacterium]
MGVEDVLFQKFGKTFPAGTVLFREGEGGDEMYVIHAGTVRITKEIRGREKFLAELGQGEFFGEMAILNAKPRSATATVSSEAKLIVINPKVFEAMILGSTEVALRMVKRLASRLQEADEQIENLMMRDARSRVVHFLLSQDAKGMNPLPFVAEDLPSQLGLPLDEIEEVFEGLRKKGFVETTEETTRLVDRAKLQQYLEFLEMKEQFGDA